MTHASVSVKIGISRSTLYRHWPDVSEMRKDVFKRATIPPKMTPPTDGPLRTDLIWLLGILVNALNETPWGHISPQVISAAANNDGARDVITQFMKERRATVRAVFATADARGELAPAAAVEYLIQMAILVPYFRKLIAGLPIDHDWLDTHVHHICRLAQGRDA